MASGYSGTLYTGVTANLVSRVWQHQQGTTLGFTAKYLCKTLVWHELHATMESAILREKQIKGGSRKKKIALIQQLNPHWHDLYPALA